MLVGFVHAVLQDMLHVPAYNQLPETGVDVWKDSEELEWYNVDYFLVNELRVQPVVY
jgi:hypothetical protein